MQRNKKRYDKKVESRKYQEREPVNSSCGLVKLQAKEEKYNEASFHFSGNWQ